MKFIEMTNRKKKLSLRLFHKSSSLQLGTSFDYIFLVKNNNQPNVFLYQCGGVEFRCCFLFLSLFLSLTLSPYISHSLRLMFGKKIFDGIHPPDQPAIPVTKFRVMDYYLKCLRQDVDIYGTKKKNNFV